MKIYFLLFHEFFKTGLLSVGGGYATIPFLHRLVSCYDWYSSDQLTNMIAVSILTPGPVGINMATFAGYHASGFAGALVATSSVVLPSYIIVVFISKILDKFRENFWIKSVLAVLKPVGCGLLTVVGINLFRENVTTIPAFCMFVFFFLCSFKVKKNPLFYIFFAAITGMILQYLKII